MARRTPFVASALACLGALAVAGFAEPPRFGSGASLVTLDLVVRDRGGNVVRDLRPEEVEVYEDGVRQELAGLEAVSSADPSASPAAAGSSGAGRKASGSAAPRAGGAAVPGAASAPRLVALVFDQLSVEGRPLAAKAARSLVEKQLGPDAYVAVFRIDGRLKLVASFTRERGDVLDSLDAATLGNAPAFASAVAAMSGGVAGSRNGGDPQQRGFDRRELRPAHHAGDPEAGSPMDGDGPLAAERGIANATLNILRTAEEVERTQRGHRSLDGLLSVVHGVRALPGRKTLVFFSEGLQVPPWLEDPFRALASDANRAGVSIYGVDVRGLRPAGHMDDARALLEQAVMISRSQRLSGGNWHGVTREQAREFEAVEATLRMDSHGALDDLAKGTGGFLIGDSNDLERGLRRLGEDTRHHYALAYAPGDPRLDGRFHRVSVRVRRPGVAVQSREGYFAIPHAVGEPVYGYEGPLLTALAARRPPTAFAHQAGVFRFGRDGARVRHAVAVAAPLAQAAFRRDERAGRYLGRVSVLALVKDARGDVVAKVGQDFVIEGPLSDLEATRRRRIVFSRPVSLAPGGYTVHVAVRDALADRTGCSVLRLDVAPPGDGVALSSLVALAGASAVDPETAGAAADDDVFRVGGVRLSPELGGALRAQPAEEAVAFYYVVYASAGGAAATLEVERAGRVLRRSPLALAPADAEGRHVQLTRLPVAGLAPGEYTVRVTVAQGPATASETVRLSIAPDSGRSARTETARQ